MLREIEKELDSYHLSSTFLNKTKRQSVTDLMIVYEILSVSNSCPLKYLNCINPLFFRFNKSELTDSLNVAIKWIFMNSNDKELDNCSFNLNELCDTLYFYTNYALPYSRVIDILLVLQEKDILLKLILKKKNYLLMLQMRKSRLF